MVINLSMQLLMMRWLPGCYTYTKTRPDKTKLHNEKSAQSVKEYVAEYKIDIGNVYDILDQICKDTHLYPYVKQHKSKKDGRGAFYAIHFRWLSSNHVNRASEAELALQMSTYHREKNAWNWEKYVAQYVKYISTFEI